MARTVALPELQQDASVGSTILAAIAALLLSTIALVVLGLPVAIGLGAAASANDLHFGSMPEAMAWPEVQGLDLWIYWGVALLGAIATFAGLWLAFLLFRRASRTWTILAFIVIELALNHVTFAPTHQAEAAMGYWGIGGMGFACLACLVWAWRSESGLGEASSETFRLETLGSHLSSLRIPKSGTV